MGEPLDKVTATIRKKWLYVIVLFAIVIIAIGIYFYWKISTTDKLKIIMMKKGEGILVGDYVVFNFTIKVANIGTNDVEGAYIVIKLYSDHSEVPTIGSNIIELGTIEAGWEDTRTTIITVSKYYSIDHAEAIIYLGDRVLDKQTLHF